MLSAAMKTTAATHGSGRMRAERRRKSRVPVAWSTMPAARKSGPL